MNYKIVKQKPPYSPYRSALEVKVWKKKVYVRGWYVWLQVGQNAWLLGPKNDPIGPNPRRTK